MVSSHAVVAIADDSPDAQLRTQRVELILNQIDSLPTLSPIATRLLSLGASDQVELSEISRLIESDPAMTAKVLGLCRRSDRGLGERVGSVRRAIVMLGLGPVRAAALSVCAFELMSAAAHDLDERVEPAAGLPSFDRTGFWKHLIAVASAAELLAAHATRIKIAPEEAFVAGLLHAIGKPVLDMILPRSYARVLALAERQGLDSAPIERSVIGLDHHTAGKRLGERWGLPDRLCEVMWLYNTPLETLPDSPSRPMIGLVTLAKAIVRRMHLGWSADYGPPADARAIWKALDLGTGADGILRETIEPKLHAAVADRLSILGLSPASADAGELAPAEQASALLLESLAAANRQLTRINTALEDRARQSQTASRALTAIAEFQAVTTGMDDPDDLIAAIGRSATTILGEAELAIAWRAAADRDWELSRFSAGAWRRITLSGSSRRDAASLTPVLPEDMGEPRVIPFAGDPATSGRPTPALAGPSQRTANHMPDAVLFHPQGFADRGLPDAHARAVSGAWAAALAAVLRSAELRRIGERLAETNRGLASMQSSLTRAQSLARLAEMTAGAAHEMNNPLTVISGHAQLLGSRVRDPKDRAAVAAVIAAAQQLTELISSLHLVARPPVPSHVTADLDWAIGLAVAAARQRTQREIHVVLNLIETPAIVRIDPTLFAQALAELIINAVEAVPREAVEIRAQIDRVEDQLQVSVIDRGEGFSEKALNHAFDPFFSEKPAGRGRGLGLTRARSLADAMAGRITIASTAGQGSVVTLSIPGWRVTVAEAAKVGAAAKRSAA